MNAVALATAQRAEIHVGVSDDTLRDLATRFRAPAPVLTAGCAACGCPCATGPGCGCTCCCAYEPAVAVTTASIGGAR